MRSNRHASQADTRSGTADEYRAKRAELRARLAAERAELLCSLLGVEVEALEGRPVLGEASATTFLATLAAREDSFAALVEESLASPPAGAPEGTGVLERIDGFEDALARCVGARSRFLDAFARVADEVVFTPTAESGGTPSSLSMAEQCYWNDASLSVRAGTWSRQEGLGEGVGPASLLRAAMRAARKELLTTCALVPTGARAVPAFEGGRSLPEIFRMVTRLERMFLDSLSRAGYEAPAPSSERNALDEDEWHRAWADLHATHAGLLGVLEALDATEFAKEIMDGDGNAESVYMWARGCLLHDRLHAAHIRADLELDWPQRLLR
jgi:hypothetical protein